MTTTMGKPMPTVLWGRDHRDLGKVALAPVGERVGLALTRGGAPKSYAHTDANEDVVAAVVGARATLLVVADGHHGVSGAEIAVRTVLERLGEDPPPADLTDTALVELFYAASVAVERGTAKLRRERDSRTTLTVALVAGRRLQWAAMGDSPLYVAAGGEARELTRPAHRFVGYAASPVEADRTTQRGAEDLGADQWVVVASDGFSNFTGGPSSSATVAEALRGQLAPVDAARLLVDLANSGGAGDNVAVAVLAPDPHRAP